MSAGAPSTKQRRRRPRDEARQLVATDASQWTTRRASRRRDGRTVVGAGELQFSLADDRRPAGLSEISGALQRRLQPAAQRPRRCRHDDGSLLRHAALGGRRRLFQSRDQCRTCARRFRSASPPMPMAPSPRSAARLPTVRFQRWFLRQIIGLGGSASARQDPETGGYDETLQTAQISSPARFPKIASPSPSANSPRPIFSTTTNTPMTRPRAFSTSPSIRWALSITAPTWWGYTYGAALEWKQDRWTARAGLFQLSQYPELAVDRAAHRPISSRAVAELREPL